MPVSYRIDPERRVIRTRIEGRLSGDELRAHFDDLLADPLCPGELYVLVDATTMAQILSVDLIQAAASQMSRVRARVRFLAAAVVTAGTAQYGMFRMSQVMLEPFFGPTHVFHDLAEAEAWIERVRAGAE